MSYSKTAIENNVTNKLSQRKGENLSMICTHKNNNKEYFSCCYSKKKSSLRKMRSIKIRQINQSTYKN